VLNITHEMHQMTLGSGRLERSHDPWPEHHTSMLNRKPPTTGFPVNLTMPWGGVTGASWHPRLRDQCWRVIPSSCSPASRSVVPPAPRSGAHGSACAGPASHGDRRHVINIHFEKAHTAPSPSPVGADLPRLGRPGGVVPPPREGEGRHPAAVRSGIIRVGPGGVVTCQAGPDGTPEAPSL
jgi:hypothetical protein